MRVLLNVGGTRFETSVETLTKFPDSLLTRWTDPCNTSLVEYCEDGAVFIDRDPILFGALLRYLRTGHLCVPPNLTVDIMLAEADYFLIPIGAAEPRQLGEHLQATATSVYMDRSVHSAAQYDSSLA